MWSRHFNQLVTPTFKHVAKHFNTPSHEEYLSIIPSFPVIFYKRLIQIISFESDSVKKKTEATYEVNVSGR